MTSPLRIVEATGSTNDDVLALGAARYPHGTAVAAKRQTTGRGRRGHTWVSPKGGLYLSVLLKPDVDPSLLSALPVVCALGALKALRSLGAEGLRLKWPNDMIALGTDGSIRKLAGILVETRSDPEGAGIYSVAGIGINLFRPEREVIHPTLVHDGMLHPLAPAYLEDCLPPAAAKSIEEDFASFAVLVRDGMVGSVDGWAKAADERSRGPLAGVLDAYLPELVFRGEEVRAVSPSGEVLACGTFDGVDASGRACLHEQDGTTQCFLPESASLRRVMDG